MTEVPSNTFVSNINEKDESSPSLNSNSIIYVLSRSSNDKISKIGSTKVSAESRANDYTDGEWSVYSQITVPSIFHFTVEKFSHEILKQKGYWLDPKISGGSANEIFLCEPITAMDAVEGSWSSVRQKTLNLLGVPVPLLKHLDGKTTGDPTIEIMVKKHEIEIGRYKNKNVELESIISQKEKEMFDLYKKLSEPFIGFDYHGDYKKILELKDIDLKNKNKEILNLEKKINNKEDMLTSTILNVEDTIQDLEYLINPENSKNSKDEFISVCKKIINLLKGLK